MTPRKITEAPLPYLWYEPETDAPLPLVVFLHGSGERGDDLEHVGDLGLAEILAGLPEAAFVAAPQCPEERRWTDLIDELEHLLTELTERYPVDPARIYLTGLSLGGQGAWVWAARNPARFAALVPICGRSSPEDAAHLTALPIWVFHGAYDEVVPLRESQKMVEALAVVGHAVRFTVFLATGHDSWTPAYRDPKLYTWLFAQRRPMARNNAARPPHP